MLNKILTNRIQQLIKNAHTRVRAIDHDQVLYPRNAKLVHYLETMNIPHIQRDKSGNRIIILKLAQALDIFYTNLLRTLT